MKTESGDALEWLSRTIAIVLVMIAPGLLGSYLDGLLKTKLLTPIGAVLGVVLATFLLIILAKQFTPPARGKPLPFNDEEEEESETDGRRDTQQERASRRDTSSS